MPPVKASSSCSKVLAKYCRARANSSQASPTGAVMALAAAASARSRGVDQPFGRGVGPAERLVGNFRWGLYVGCLQVTASSRSVW
eukprot:1517756-Pyramimonas_sp.AAC.1